MPEKHSKKDLRFLGNEGGFSNAEFFRVVFILFIILIIAYLLIFSDILFFRILGSGIAIILGLLFVWLGVIPILEDYISDFTEPIHRKKRNKYKQQHEKKITSPKEVSTWLPLVHIVIDNMKTFLNGTFHGVTHKYLQEYLDEFCYRFNRRFWEPELPLRLLNACLSHTPVSS